ncbi:Phosphoglycerate dehydrogenase [Tindallia magadiensis]|uniref:Phosphoglycerate dehydrogenase n=1 Tax=Tindallia magadiensis TaxID=69895 RepID=A0A1I3GA19_9FIRM|nr:NAD(P)-dependent oxidoreductase [Tindallia magadiensis]SFI20375.1 Phosphoglycerate dehydrogenase [Tindallia magadiensis]
MKILITAGYHLSEDKLDLLRDLGCHPVLWSKEKEPVTEEHWDADILFSYQVFNYTDVRRFHNLKLIQLTSSGIDHIPVEYLREKNIKLCNARGIYSIPIAEWVLLKTMEIYRNSRFYEKAQEAKRWKKHREMEEIYGKTVGIVGTGSIGTETAKRFHSFGAKVVGINRDGRKVEAFDECYSIHHLAKVVGEWDVLVLALPLTKDTEGLINEAILAQMKKEALLINVSRGPVIVEEALMDHLNRERLKGAALDVFQEEPLPEESLWWSHPKVLVTPHVSFLSTSVPERAFQLAYRNIKAFKEGRPLENLQP